MKAKKLLMLLLVLTLSLGMALAACGDDATDDGTDTAEPGTETEDTTDEEVTEVPQGGNVTFAMYSAPAGVYNPILYGDAYEANVIGFIFEGLVQLDLELAWEPALAKDWEYINDNATLVMYLEEDVVWHDGEPFTANDVKFTYDSIAHPEYTGVRRSTTVANLVGFEEFSNGETDVFEGVEVINDHEVHFHFKNPSPLALRDASYLIIPEHIYGQYDVADLPDAAETLEFDLLVGTGPFKASEYVTNEYYVLERHEDYWRGAPNLDRVVWRIVNQDVAPGLLETGEIDVITSPGGVNPADFDMVSEIPGVVVYETPAFAYQYMGIKLNHRPEADVEAGVVDPDNFIPNEKVQDVRLRQALAYAINRQGIVDGLLQGRGTILHAPFPEVSWAYDPDAVNEYPFDPEKAKALLDEAEITDQNGDGWRQLPDGSELVLRLDYPTGNQVRERSAPIIQENLQDVGIKVDLRTPRDVGAHFDAVEDDEPGMDLFLAGWSLATADPDPKGIWDTDTLWNFPRWNDEYQQELIDSAVLDERAFDQEWRASVYKEWATYVNEQLPYIFLYSQNDIFAYNDRIQNVIHGPTGITRDIHEWYVID